MLDVLIFVDFIHQVMLEELLKGKCIFVVAEEILSQVSNECGNYYGK